MADSDSDTQRWILIPYVLLVHSAFGLTALTVVLFFCNVAFGIPWFPVMDTSYVGESFENDIFIDVLLFLLFGLVHFLAFPVLDGPRIPFHKKITKADFENWLYSEAQRSHFVILVTVVLLVLVWQWRPLPADVWDFREWKLASVAVQGAYIFGWFLLVFVRIRQVLRAQRDVMRKIWKNPFKDLFMRGVLSIASLTNPTDIFAVERAPFLGRHPIMGAFCIIFWSTPHMTVGYLVVAFAMTVHILVRVQVEEILLNRRAAVKLLQGLDVVSPYSAYASPPTPRNPSPSREPTITDDEFASGGFRSLAVGSASDRSRAVPISERGQIPELTKDGTLVRRRSKSPPLAQDVESWGSRKYTRGTQTS